MTTFFIGQKFEPGMFPIVEDIYRIDTTIERRWFIIHAAPNREGKASEEVERLGFEPCVPKRTFWGKRDRRTNKMPRQSAPVLSGYVPVKMPVEGAFDVVRKCDGVVGFIDFRGAPATIPDAWIDEVRDREANGEFDSTRRRRTVRNDKSPFPSWIFPGALVRVADGPFATFLGKVIEAVREGRLKVETRLFGRATTIDLELAQVEQL